MPYLAVWLSGAKEGKAVIKGVDGQYNLDKKRYKFHGEIDGT